MHTMSSIRGRLSVSWISLRNIGEVKDQVGESRAESAARPFPASMNYCYLPSFYYLYDCLSYLLDYSH